MQAVTSWSHDIGSVIGLGKEEGSEGGGGGEEEGGVEKGRLWEQRHAAFLLNLILPCSTSTKSLLN